MKGNIDNLATHIVCMYIHELLYTFISLCDFFFFFHLFFYLFSRVSLPLPVFLCVAPVVPPRVPPFVPSFVPSVGGKAYNLIAFSL